MTPVRSVHTLQGTDIGPLINAYTAEGGDEPRGLLALLIAESGLDERAARYGTWPDVSFGLGQQTVAYAPVGDRTASAANIAYVRDYYFHPSNAILEAARQYGAYYRQTGSYHEAVAKYNGGPRASWASIPAANRANYERAWAEAGQYEAVDTPTYHPDLPAERQLQTWTCSVRATTWALKSLGISIDAGTMQDLMVDNGLVNPAYGLLDGSGAPLARWLGVRFDLDGIERQHPAYWEWVTTVAGQGPVLIGGAAWNHWSPVRRVSSDHLELANPAPGWMGVYDQLTRADWDRLGPWAALWIPVDMAEGEDMARIAEMETLLGYLTHDVADALSGAAEDLRATLDALGSTRLTVAQRKRVNAALAAVESGLNPAIDTLRRGGPPEDAP